MIAFLDPATEFVAGLALRRIAWFTMMSLCFLVISKLVLVTLPFAFGARGVPLTLWKDAPVEMFVSFFIGCFLAPIRSTVLTAVPVRQHGTRSGLSMMFSAMVGTAASLGIRRLFQCYSGQTKFNCLPVACVVLPVCLSFFNNLNRGTVEQTSL